MEFRTSKRIGDESESALEASKLAEEANRLAAEASESAAEACEPAAETLDRALAARELAYRVLHALLSQPPTRGNAEVALSDVFEQALDFAGATADAPQFEQQREAFDCDPDGFTRAAADEYQRLFYAPGRLAAPPWESSWRSAERKVFQRCTLEVRDAYRAQGFRPVSVNRIPDDHVAIELCFLAQLARRAKEEAANRAVGAPVGERVPDDVRCGTPPLPEASVGASPAAFAGAQSGASALEAALPALGASKAFLADHLGCWVDDYAAALERASGSGLYAHIARCLRAFVSADGRWLDQLGRPAPETGKAPGAQKVSNRPTQTATPAARAS